MSVYNDSCHAWHDIMISCLFDHVKFDLSWLRGGANRI